MFPYSAFMSVGDRTEDASDKGDTLMKRISAICLFTLATLAATTGLFAQAPAVKANIPFNFTVGEKWLPAGEYTISSPDRYLLQIQSADGHYKEMVIATHSFAEPGASSKLVFERYGEYYFLHQISTPASTSLNLQVASSKVEKRVRTQEARVQTGEQTLVAAR
jgi:hypothetical protein